MLFNHKGVDFDIDEREISKDECIKLFTPIIDIANKFVNIVEIDVEDSEYAVILSEGGDVMKFAKELQAYNIESSSSDEDYGELDATNIYL